MALQHPTLAQRVASHRDLVVALLIFTAVIAVMLVATVIIGVVRPGPSYEIVPDPAGLGLPF